MDTYADEIFECEEQDRKYNLGRPGADDDLWNKKNRLKIRSDIRAQFNKPKGGK